MRRLTVVAFLILTMLFQCRGLLCEEGCTVTVTCHSELLNDTYIKTVSGCGTSCKPMYKAVTEPYVSCPSDWQ